MYVMPCPQRSIAAAGMGEGQDRPDIKSHRLLIRMPMKALEVTKLALTDLN